MIIRSEHVRGVTGCEGGSCVGRPKRVEHLLLGLLALCVEYTRLLLIIELEWLLLVVSALHLEGIRCRFELKGRGLLLEGVVWLELVIVTEGVLLSSTGESRLVH